MREDGIFSWKFWILKFGLILSLIILLAVALKLTVIEGKYYRQVARENKILEMTIPATRAEIVDRKGRVVAKTTYQDGGDFDGYKFEGKDLAYELGREYPYGESLSMVTGYVGKVSEMDIKNNKCGNKFFGEDLVGRGGIEDYFDCQIRGKNGKRVIEVDALGNYIRELGREEPETKNQIVLSVDAYWQDKIYKLLNGKKAAVVVSEPKTGKIIALVSSPSFDSNVFLGQDNKKISEYLDDKDKLPLLNRVISAKYHPGSVFKIMMATAGLETGVIDENTLIEDTGVIKVGDYSYKTWSSRRDGMVDIVKAIKRSNDIFFYKLGEMLGVDNIKKWANKFGFGKKTGVELIGEIEGIVPDDEWKRLIKGEPWYLGNTYHLSIGQGDLDVTPIQINQMTNIIANNGVKCKMSILKDSKVECEDIGINSEIINIITKGMKQACHSGGTAWPLFNFKTELACKTGTAEVGDGSNDTHAWLTAFAPADNPQISITVMLERGGEGSDEAAPIVGDILKEWFNEPNTIVPRYSEEEGE
jgi:penicillin-binding protein 2